MKFLVELSQRVLEKTRLVVEAESREELVRRLGEVYSAERWETIDLDWECDDMWEGTHFILNEVKDDRPANFTLAPENEGQDDRTADESR